MLINSMMIVCGVSALLWLSTLGENDIRSKMEYFGTAAGATVAMILFLIPPSILLRKIAVGAITARSLAYSIVLVISFQLLLFSYIPVIVNTYEGTATDIADFVIDSKN